MKEGEQGARAKPATGVSPGRVLAGGPALKAPWRTLISPDPGLVGQAVRPPPAIQALLEEHARGWWQRRGAIKLTG